MKGVVLSEQQCESSGAGDGGAPPSTLDVSLLNGFAVAVAAHPIPDGAWRTQKARHLLKILALEDGHRLHREQVVDLLWPDLEPAAALNNFRSALHAARLALEPTQQAGRSAYLQLANDLLGLTAPGGVRIDVDEFRDAATACRQRGTAEAYRAALALYPGELLPEDRYEDWAAAPREALRETWLSLIVELGNIYEASGDFAAGVEVLERAIAAAPTHEDAHAGLMRLHALAGRPGHAVRQYLRLRDAVARELDVEPLPATTALRDEIAAGRFGAGATGPPQCDRRPRSTRTNLTAAVDSYVERAGEIGALAATCRASRLVTLLGTGGVGKTRLLTELGRSLAPTSTFGAIWFVDLEGVSTQHAIETAIAAASGDDAAAWRSPVGTDADGGTLLLLDGCEHAIDACADAIAALLGAMAELRIVTTSRSPLRVAGEVIWHVLPLAVPPLDHAQPLDELADVEAMRLLIDRVRAVDPGFAVTQRAASTLAWLCRELDGLPLAVELAARPVTLLGPRQLRRRFDAPLDLLTGGRRDSTCRHRDLRRSLEWSHALLDEPSQVVFRRLAVFAGGYTLDAAESVCAADHAELDVFESLTQLVEMSLVRVDHGAGGDGDVRYSMLRTTRHFAREQLEASGEVEMIHDRHAEVVTDLLERARSGPDWPPAPGRSHWLTAAADDVDAAVCWVSGRSVHFADPRRRARLLTGAAELSLVAGALDEAADRANRALECLGDGVSDAERADLHDLLGRVHAAAGDTAGAIEQYDRASALREHLDDRGRWAATQQRLGGLALAEFDHERATDLFARSFAEHRRMGDERGVATDLIGLGTAALDRGDTTTAVRLADDSLAFWDRDDDASGRADAWSLVAVAHLHDARLDLAADAATSAMRSAATTSNPRTLAVAFEVAAAVAGAHDTRDAAIAAARLIGAADTQREVHGLTPTTRDAMRVTTPRTSALDVLGRAEFDAAVASGRAAAPDDVISTAFDFRVSPSVRTDPVPLHRLTDRERQVASFVARGLTNREIAGELAIAPRTVDTHVASVLRKLGVGRRAEIGPTLLSRTHT